jgi:hypothetical protein
MYYIAVYVSLTLYLLLALLFQPTPECDFGKTLYIRVYLASGIGLWTLHVTTDFTASVLHYFDYWFNLLTRMSNWVIVSM